MAASALLCRRGVGACICSTHLLWGCANDESRCRTPPLVLQRGRSHRPCIRWPPRRDYRGGRRDVARLWLTAPGRPIRCRFSQHRATWPGVPSFFSAYGVSCRVRAERVKPYASSAKLASDSPRGPLREGPCGPPAPGATRELGILAMRLSLIDIRLGGQFVNTHEASLCSRVRGRSFLQSSASGFSLLLATTDRLRTRDQGA